MDPLSVWASCINHLKRYLSGMVLSGMEKVDEKRAKEKKEEKKKSTIVITPRHNTRNNHNPPKTTPLPHNCSHFQSIGTAVLLGNVSARIYTHPPTHPLVSVMEQNTIKNNKASGMGFIPLGRTYWHTHLGRLLLPTPIRSSLK